MANSPSHTRSRSPLVTRTVVAATITIGILAGLVGGALPSGAVVGGTPTDVSNIPWQVSLQDSEGHFCGGSVVAADVVVTAAHCVEGLGAGDLTITAGLTNLGDQGQTRAVASVIEHPAYERTETSDIAVLILSSPLELNGAVQPIRLAVPGDIAAANVGTVSGWGSTSESDEAGSRQLLSASVPLVNDADCNRAISAEGDGGIAAEVETCAGGTGTDSCYGDSGGPLTVTAPDGTPALAGIVSWGIECGAATPGVYAEVPALAGFIADAVAGKVKPSEPTPVDDQESDFDDDLFGGDLDEDRFDDDLFDDDEFSNEFDDGLCEDDEQ